MMSLKRFRVICEHHGARHIRTIVYREIIALNEMDAVVKFMNWHEKEYPHRRAYNVECSVIECFVVW